MVTPAPPGGCVYNGHQRHRFGAKRLVIGGQAATPPMGQSDRITRPVQSGQVGSGEVKSVEWSGVVPPLADPSRYVDVTAVWPNSFLVRRYDANIITELP